MKRGWCWHRSNGVWARWMKRGWWWHRRNGVWARRWEKGRCHRSSTWRGWWFIGWTIWFSLTWGACITQVMKSGWKHFALVNYITVKWEDSRFTKARFYIRYGKSLLKGIFYYSSKVTLRHYKVFLSKWQSFHRFGEVIFEALENGHVKRLKCMCSVGRKTKQYYIIISSHIYDIKGNVRLMPINK